MSSSLYTMPHASYGLLYTYVSKERLVTSETNFKMLTLFKLKTL